MVESQSENMSTPHYNFIISFGLNRWMLLGITSQFPRDLSSYENSLHNFVY
uniref:Uncharacterized protein n=1 Tax=Arundo donax TaxID=35708 RepID=A0A0A9I1H6_ARUDO